MYLPMIPCNSLCQSGISDITNRDYDDTFRKDALYLYNADNELIHYSPKSCDAPSWTLPIQSPIAQASAVLSLLSDNKFVQFMYASLGSPVLSTLLRALRKGYFATIPRFTSALLCKYKPNSVASALGHLDRRRQGIDSTTPAPAVVSSPSPVVNSTTYDDDIINISDAPDTTIDSDPTIYVKLYSTADFDASGRFPVPSDFKYAYHLVSCFNGNIHVETMQSRTSASYNDAYDKTVLHWSRFRMVPSFVRLDAETSADLETFLTDVKKVTFQYFPTGIWKNHFISTLATASPKFLLSYWNKLIPLAEITLNCLLPWQPNPAISAYDGLTGAPCASHRPCRYCDTHTRNP
jgi:hypothetical protein